MTSPYSVNWIKGNQGNGINSGETVIVKVDGADYLSGGIYKDNLPVLAFFEMKDTAEIALIKGKTFFGRPKPLTKGTYTLKTRTATNGWDDEFQIY